MDKSFNLGFNLGFNLDLIWDFIWDTFLIYFVFNLGFNLVIISPIHQIHFPMHWKQIPNCPPFYDHQKNTVPKCSEALPTYYKMTLCTSQLDKKYFALFGRACPSVLSCPSIYLDALPCPSEPQYDMIEHRRACPSKYYYI